MTPQTRPWLYCHSLTSIALQRDARNDIELDEAPDKGHNGSNDNKGVGGSGLKEGKKGRNKRVNKSAFCGMAVCGTLIVCIGDIGARIELEKAFRVLNTPYWHPRG